MYFADPSEFFLPFFHKFLDFLFVKFCNLNGRGGVFEMFTFDTWGRDE